MSNRFDPIWRPPGPVAQRFMESSANTIILNGPLGSGKTTATFMKTVKFAKAQQPSSRHKVRNRNGVLVPARQTRWCFFRDTYRNLWKTTMRSWWKRFPEDIGVFKGSDGGPASHKIIFELRDGTAVEYEALFAAIGDNDAEAFMGGFEPTGIVLGEADKLVREVYTFGQGRTGRYPDKDGDVGPTWHGVIMDCNAPPLSNWMYEDFFRKLPEGVDLLRQPSGFSPNAENLAGLPDQYYERQRHGQPQWYIARMLENKPGFSREGKPVYPEFNDTLHVPDHELEPIPGRTLILGLDAGLTPAAIIGQQTLNGCWNILDELTSEPGVGAKRFGQRLGALLHERYPGYSIVGWADPSAAAGVDKTAGEASWIDIVENEVGIRIRPAPSNALTRRFEAVRLPLTRLIDGQPGLLLSSRCIVLREGFNSGYRFRKFTASQTERYDETPEKNSYSHPHDGLQYLLSGGGEDLEVMNRRTEMRGGPLHRQAEDAWQPFE